MRPLRRIRCGYPRTKTDGYPLAVTGACPEWDWPQWVCLGVFLQAEKRCEAKMAWGLYLHWLKEYVRVSPSAPPHCWLRWLTTAMQIYFLRRSLPLQRLAATTLTSLSSSRILHPFHSKEAGRVPLSAMPPGRQAEWDAIMKPIRDVRAVAPPPPPKRGAATAHRVFRSSRRSPMDASASSLASI